MWSGSTVRGIAISSVFAWVSRLSASAACAVRADESRDEGLSSRSATRVWVSKEAFWGGGVNTDQGRQHHIKQGFRFNINTHFPH